MADLSVRLNAAELAALAGLPSLAVVAYVLAIRPWMDYRTGIVGIIRGISWQSIREYVEVEGHQGMPRKTFSENQLRRAVGHLEKCGLLKRRSTDAALVFSCLLADQDRHVQKKAEPMSVPMSAPLRVVESRANTGSQDYRQQKGAPKAEPKAEPPPAYPLTTNQPSSSIQRSVVETTTTTIFHRVIKPDFIEAIRETICRLPADMQQLAVDELAGAILARGGGGNQIRSQIAYLRAIVDNVLAGSQVWANAYEVQAARRAEAARLEREQALRAAPAEASSERYRPGVSLADTLKGMC